MAKLIEQLSDVQIKGLIKAGRPVAKTDGGGLTLTVSEAGTATWILRYRFNRQHRELTIGRYPDITLKDARKMAGEFRAKIQSGVDVAREKQKSISERVAAKSFRSLAHDYMAKVFPRLAPLTIKQRRHHIEDVIVPKLGRLPASDVTTADVVALIDGIGQKSISVAELVFTALKEIFKHGIARHVVTVNPCAGISVSAICGKAEPKRSRKMLTADELKVILPALPSIGREHALVVKILLSTCVRIGELIRAEWVHVDFAKGEWLIPDANSKTGKGFVVPLTPSVIEWFRELHTFACGSALVLPAKRNRGGKGYAEQRAVNAALHRLCDRLGGKVRRFTPHDLRSTARSHLAALGVSVAVAERCLNHVLGGLVAVYDRHDYMVERRAALELWTRFILTCERDDQWNVVPLRTTAGR